MIRAWILLGTVLLCLSGCKTGQAENSNTTHPPNILWISCEDISPALGCYGDPYAFTPTLDGLAEEGVLFTRAYATAPICAPARSTLISGIYATTLGTQHLRSDIPVPEGFRILPQYLRDAGYFCSNNAKTDYNFSIEGRWNDQGNEAHWRNRQEGQPFFSVFNYGITHEGPANRLIEEDVATLEILHDPDSAKLPPYFPDSPQMRRIWAHQYDLISVLDQQVKARIAELKEDGLYDNTIIFFFSDHGFGLPRYKRWLYHTGLHIPFIVRVPDQYRHLFDHKPGSQEDRLVSFVDFAPTVLNLAGVDIPESFAGSPFMGPDSDRKKKYVFGARSRADDIYEVSRCVLDERYIYIRNFMPYQSYVTEAVIFSDRKASYAELLKLKHMGKLHHESEKFWQPKAYEELYDLHEDPHELVNLAGHPDHSGRVEEMRKVLYTWMVEQRDVGLLNESEMMIRSEGSTPYEMGASAEYPVETILDAALLCGNPDASLEDILPLLDHADAGVRYWGVLSLHAKADVGQGAPELLRGLLNDPSSTVAIAAAELLCNMGMYKDGIPALERGLRSEEHPTLVLQAAISARNLKSGAKPLLPVIEEIYPQYRGTVWERYKDWTYSMFIGFALDQVYLNCGLEIPR